MGNWIRCDRELPREFETVLCFLDCSMVDKQKNNIKSCVGAGFWQSDIDLKEKMYWAFFNNPHYRYFGCVIGENTQGKITHWMPMPKSPIEIECLNNHDRQSI